MFKVNNKNTRTTSLTTSQYISQLFLVILLLTLNMQMLEKCFHKREIFNSDFLDLLHEATSRSDWLKMSYWNQYRYYNQCEIKANQLHCMLQTNHSYMWYHLYNFKNVKKKPGGVLLFVKM